MVGAGLVPAARYKIRIHDIVYWATTRACSYNITMTLNSYILITDLKKHSHKLMGRVESYLK